MSLFLEHFRFAQPAWLLLLVPALLLIVPVSYTHLTLPTIYSV